MRLKPPRLVYFSQMCSKANMKSSEKMLASTTRCYEMQGDGDAEESGDSRKLQRAVSNIEEIFEEDQKEVQLVTVIERAKRTMLSARNASK